MKKRMRFPAIAAVLVSVIVYSFFSGISAEAEQLQGDGTASGIVSASTVVTNLTGWKTRDAGRMEETAAGLRLSSAENGFALADERAEDFTYEADVTFPEERGVGSLVFRSNDSGWGSYMLQLDPGANVLRLKDANGDRGLGEVPVEVQAGVAYHLKVKAEGTALKVYWNGGEDPLIAVKDGAYPTGFLGLHVWNSTAVFQNIMLTVLDTGTRPGTVNTNLTGWKTKDAGRMEETAAGLQLSSVENGFALADTRAEDFTYEADVTFPEERGIASLVFRSNDSGWGSYMLQLDPGANVLRLKDANGDRRLGEVPVEVQAGVGYHLKVKAEGTALKIYWNGGDAPLIAVTDGAYTSGYFGLHVWNSAAVFQNIYAEGLRASSSMDLSSVNTNLTDWTLRGIGTAAASPEGLLLESTGQALAMSRTKAQNFTYEADVAFREGAAVGSLVFRSDDTGREAYKVQLDAKKGKLRLIDANAAHSGRLWVEKSAAVVPGDIYHLRVTASDSNLSVYWNNRYDPLISVSNSVYSGMQLGLQADGGSVVFQNIRVSDLQTNLHGFHSTGGDWLNDADGIKGSAPAFNWEARIADDSGRDFVLEGDVTVAPETPGAAAGLIFRSDLEGTTGYIVSLEPGTNAVKLLKQGPGGTEELSSSQHIPLAAGKQHHIEITAVSVSIAVYIDGYEAAAAILSDSTYLQGFSGLAVKGGTAYFQNVYTTPADDYYAEMYRPQYHYSPARGAASDPNGLVYFEVEYHLFHQDGGQWAHAVSTDLLHWKRLPFALKWNALGHIWSGSAVADETNASGLFGDSGGKGLIAYYTSFNPDKPGGNQKIGLAYSKDKGRTWEYYGDRAIIPNPGYVSDSEPGGWDFRDPKVVRDEANNRWVMVVSGGDHIRFFTSTNLMDWTHTDNFGYGAYIRGGVWECPDLFELPVAGSDGAKKWVLMLSTGANDKTGGSDSEYFVGQLTPEGKFRNDNPPGTVLKTDFGKEKYASMTFANAPDNRRILLAWMTNWDYPFSFPTGSWKGQMTIPRELTLKSTAAGVRLVESPSAKLSELRGTPFKVNHSTVTPETPNVLSTFRGTAYEIEATLKLPAEGAASEFGFRLRAGGDQETVVGYRQEGGKLFVDRSASGRTNFAYKFSKLQEAELRKDGSGTIKLNIFVDESSVEVFGGNGETVITDLIFPDSARSGASFYALGGAVDIKSLHIYPLANTWRSSFDQGTTEEVVLDRGLLELETGVTRQVYGDVRPYSSGERKLVWTSSNPAVAQVEPVDDRSARVRAVAAGTAVVTATYGGGVSDSMQVTVGHFETNLSGWQAYPSGQWVTTDKGITGSYYLDSNYMSGVQAADFTYEADVVMAKTGGAGSILFRANADGTSGYYFNIDPNMRSLRLFYMADGQFADRQLLAKVPMFLETGRTYHAKIVAEAFHIRIYLDGALMIDVVDDTYTQGFLGLNVFGGETSYQNVQLAVTTPADLSRYRLVNLANGLLLSAESQERFARLSVLPDRNSANQEWTLFPAKDETRTIRSSVSGRSMDWDTGANRIQLYPYLGYDNQRWLLVANDDGSVTLVSAHDSGQALAVQPDGQVAMSGRSGAPEQKWRVERVTAGN